MDINDIVNSVSTDLTFPMDRLPTGQESVLARQAVNQLQSSVTAIRGQVSAEKARIAELQALHEATINSLEDQRDELEAKISKAQAYLAPVRKLPDELLSEVFVIMWCAGDKKCGWKLASVCRLWRRVALSLPKIWSAIHLKTTTAACPAEIIRLWLERSGRTVPLDIDITLNRIPGSSSVVEKPAAARRRILNAAAAAHQQNLPGMWNVMSNHATSSQLSPLQYPYSSSSSFSKADDDPSAGSATAWGYIVFDYLVKQLDRWKRFRFMFSSSFPSIKTLDEIRGRAPLLEEFIIGNTDGPVYTSGDHWRWLPSSDPRQWSASKPTPKLRVLELRNVPFQWSSPMLSGLTTLKLVGTSIAQPLALNRVMAILSASPNIKTLELNIITQPNILPLAPVTLEALEELKLGAPGNQPHNCLQLLIGQLITPSLSSLSIEVECRTDTSGMTETLNNLLLRSSSPLVKSFSYGPPSSSAPSNVMNYGLYATCFPLNVLPNMYHLETLTVNVSAMDQIFGALASPQGQQDIDHVDEETDFGGPTAPGAFIGGWMANSPPLTTLAAGGTTVNTLIGGLTGILSNVVAQAPNNIGGPGGANAATNALINAAAANANNGGPVSIFTGLPGLMGGTPGPQHHFNDDYLCPYLRKLTLKHSNPSPEGVTKLIKMVEARNPDRLGGAGHADASIPRRLRSLELLECGAIGGDVIEWLEERIDHVVYTEASGGSSSYRHTTTSYHYATAF